VSANRLAWTGSVLGLAAVAAAAAMLSTADSWQPIVLVVLLFALAVLADRYELTSSEHMPVVGSLPIFVLAAVLLGPAPGAAIGIAASLLQPSKPDHLRASPRLLLAGDVAIYGFFLLVVGFGVQELMELADATATSAWFVVLVAGGYLVACALNYLLVAVFMRVVDDRPIKDQLLSTYVPLLSVNAAQGVLTAMIALLYELLGLPALMLSMLALAVYMRLQGELLEARQHARDARERAQRLARMNFGVLRAMLNAVHARDNMTARHSAAVARYATAIAAAAGCDESDQELVHTAGLLHDIGKFAFTDAIFWSAGQLSDEQWQTIRRHPEQGAEIVRHLEGHGEVAKIILAHHERIDGKGYPNGLVGEDIPRLARMISVADTYDVMTARDSYKRPVAHEDAIAELRRVSGAQLDGELVEIFITKVLAGTGVAFGHGDDVDFEAELALVERRSHVDPDPEPLQLPAPVAA
jgi:putative nucleotidyltransferase with HDIG domain